MRAAPNGLICTVTAARVRAAAAAAVPASSSDCSTPSPRGRPASLLGCEDAAEDGRSGAEAELPADAADAAVLLRSLLKPCRPTNDA
jgi:hypothetical protein